jgi:hypothetical protein
VLQNGVCQLMKSAVRTDVELERQFAADKTEAFEQSRRERKKVEMSL